jgi:hypothetical protein
MAFGYHCPSRNMHAEYEVLGAERTKHVPKCRPPFDLSRMMSF